jgi:hypothetical protein
MIVMMVAVIRLLLRAHRQPRMTVGSVMSVLVGPRPVAMGKRPVHTRSVCAGRENEVAGGRAPEIARTLHNLVRRRLIDYDKSVRDCPGGVERMEHSEGAVGVLDRHDEIVEPGPPPEERPPVDPTAGETVLVRQIRFFTAICSFAAGILHILAMVAHADHHPTLGRAFLAIAAVQIAWGVMLIVEPRRMVVLLGALATAGAIVVWIFSRTKGISWFPGLEDVEPLEWRDVVAQFFQLLAVAGATVLLLPASVHKPAGKKIDVLPIAVMAVLAMGALAVLYAATHNYTHHG